MQISAIGIDLAKNVFQVHGVDAAEKKGETWRRSRRRARRPARRKRGRKAHDQRNLECAEARRLNLPVSTEYVVTGIEKSNNRFQFGGLEGGKFLSYGVPIAA